MKTIVELSLDELHQVVNLREKIASLQSMLEQVASTPGESALTGPPAIVAGSAWPGVGNPSEYKPKRKYRKRRKKKMVADNKPRAGKKIPWMQTNEGRDRLRQVALARHRKLKRLGKKGFASLKKADKKTF